MTFWGTGLHGSAIAPTQADDKKAGADAVDPGVQEIAPKDDGAASSARHTRSEPEHELKAATTSCARTAEDHSRGRTGGVMGRLLRDWAETRPLIAAGGSDAVYCRECVS
jgi:hypothetical protein